uniref:Uncharacterized protein n=1 Tax=Vannella robusta TaxID=1487602 RepID=A0A7S4HHF6_9EUKA
MAWPVRHATLSAIESYSKFSLFDFKGIVPRKHLPKVLQFLKREYSPLSTEFEYTHLKNQQRMFSQVLVGRKRGLPLSQEGKPQKHQKTSPEQQIKEGLELIREALRSIHPSTMREHKSLLAKEFQSFQNV